MVVSREVAGPVQHTASNKGAEIRMTTSYLVQGRLSAFPPCGYCGASYEAHEEVCEYGGIRGHRINRPDQPQHGMYHAFSPMPPDGHTQMFNSHTPDTSSILTIYRTHINRRAQYIDKCQVLHHELEQMDLAAIQEIVNASTLTPTSSVPPVKG